MKKVVLFLMTISLILLSGCSYVAYKDYYTDPSNYQKIWSLTGFGYDFEGVSPIFPESIKDLIVEKFFCRYDQQLPLGEGVQLFVQIKYDDDSYTKEIERIKPLSFECNDSFDENTLSFRAKSLCEDGISEYVAYDDENQCIYYIYLQYIPKGEIEFEHSFLPNNYS